MLTVVEMGNAAEEPTWGLAVGARGVAAQQSLEADNLLTPAQESGDHQAV